MSQNRSSAKYFIAIIFFVGMFVTSCQFNTPKENLNDLLTRFCWVAYSPTYFDPTTNPVRWPTEQSIRKDLQVLHDAGFNGLVTYGSIYMNGDSSDEVLDIPKLAQKAGFEGMIIGVWDPTDENEIKTAETMGQDSSIVVGYSVGNEGLDIRYDLGTLTSAMNKLRNSTGKPVTTTEQVSDYYENSPLWEISDWIFPNTHPYFSRYSDPDEAVQWTVKVFNNLDPVSEKTLIFKEVGLPTDGDLDVSESQQAKYYRLLQKTNVIFVVFEAFDAPWKHIGAKNPDGSYPWPDPEPHWGVFKSDRTPKEAVKNICPKQ